MISRNQSGERKAGSAASIRIFSGSAKAPAKPQPTAPYGKPAGARNVTQEAGRRGGEPSAARAVKVTTKTPRRAAAGRWTCCCLPLGCLGRPAGLLDALWGVLSP